MSKAQEATRLGLEQWQAVNATYFRVPYQSGGVSVELPGIFLTPDPSQQLPLLIWVTGMDYPKEVRLALHCMQIQCMDSQLHARYT